MDRKISPPPLKRRKLAPPDCVEDAKPEGNPPPQPLDAPKTVRLFSWNVNGIGPFVPPPSSGRITTFFKPSSGAEAVPQRSSHSLRAFLSRHNWPEVLFLQELKVDPANPTALARLLSAVNTPCLGPGDRSTPDRTYTLDASLPRDRHNAGAFQGRLYGVGTVLRADFARAHVARVRAVDWDLEGRVSIVETRSPAPPPPAAGETRPQATKADTEGSSSSSRLALINVYAVNGTSAPYRDPATGAPAAGGRTRHDHKVAFHARLRDECLGLERRGFGVVVAGDLNVARGPLDGYPRLRTWPARHAVNRADFNVRFFGEGDNVRAGAYVGAEGEGRGPCLDGVDAFRAVHGLERRYTYYPRTREWGSSCDRVDLVIVSKALWESGRVLGTGILDSPAERGPSDHVPLWVEVALGDLGPSEIRKPKKDGVD
ncbi:Endonuclease/exonuclease/phosphatase [Phialemonium atrogriseum]|uniref:Endonuclease/exonuclease/phosphatase n=1 Tax=Phialemonium atrogriseum TaxID=1093897 RepID=A0AAJ0CB00_9PEZI|nr:Endonuclease/exonuclease/phosphatase [Phialemonium atrogriseum]KAK1771904.1 Endonuclease/exonuclease/phosphatase [Phialemonium atrogriseum]